MDTALCALGDFAWDVLVQSDKDLLSGGDAFGNLVLAPGGSAANVAVWATRCGISAQFIGKVGRDHFGRLARENLAEEGVESYLVETEDHPTGCVAVLIDQTGQRSMVSGHGADFSLLPADLPRKMLSNVRHLHLTAWSLFTDPPRLACTEAALTAHEAGATLSLDPASFQMIAEMGVDPFLDLITDLNIDVLLPNKDEGAILTGFTEPAAIANRLSELFPGTLIILKLDADGALIVQDGQSYSIPTATSSPLDATGAGDSFAGAFLAKFIGGVSAFESARFATQIAGWVIERLGARPEPDHRLEELIASADT